MHAAINETLRLFPPVPINIRESRENGVLLPNSDPTYPDPDPQPLYFPGSTIVMYFPMHAQRNKALWGPDADEFDPDRWLDERLRKYTDNPMMYTPFSGGPRIVSLGLHELFLFWLRDGGSLICFVFAVLGAELREERGILLPRPPIARVRHVHSCFRRPTRRFSPAIRMEDREGPAVYGEDMACLRDDLVRQGVPLHL